MLTFVIDMKMQVALHGMFLGFNLMLNPQQLQTEPLQSHP